MIKKIVLSDKTVNYELTYKNVKNINLRIKPDGTVCVSANKRVSEKVIDEFMISKSEFILKALKTFEEKSAKIQKQYFSEDEICHVILNIVDTVYPYYREKGIEYPKIKFRKMVSRWGSCHIQKGILTFNKNLMYAPKDCVQYVVFHEFTHFIHPNHSKDFYDELSEVCPDWKKRRKALKEI